jgi:hypothetical protein
VNNVKKNNLTKGAFALLLLSSAVVKADIQYPAADFQPEVIYQNSDYIAKNSPQTATTKTATVVKAASKESANLHDENYPAADFKPEVLYHDPNYKHNESAKVSSSEEQGSSTGASAEENSSISTYSIGLAFLALAGFYLFKKAGASTNKEKSSSPARKIYAANTGVAKYLNKLSGTGVSRYLDSHIKTVSAATGVDKYMAKQTASEKQTAAKSATGVEKYMRDRG